MEHIRFELYFSENISLDDFVMESIRINKLRMVIFEPKLFDNLMLLEKKHVNFIYSDLILTFDGLSSEKKIGFRPVVLKSMHRQKM